MAKITFYPLGNADSTLIEFADGCLMLEDYCHRKDPSDKNDKRADLSAELRAVLEEKDRDNFDVVAFSHSDDDHVGNAESFFWLDYAKEYQGGDRIKIDELWVPSCFILEKGLESSAKIIRQEARHRLKNNYGIRIFGNPGILDDWLEENDIDPKDREHLITHAGEVLKFNNAEVFVHSPFSFKMEDEEVDRNGSCLVFHITFFEDSNSTRLMLGSDAEYESWDSIIIKTRHKGRPERLVWDIFRISHHCSYTALSSEKGKEKTEPIETIKGLFEEGQIECYLISSSDPIPPEDTKQRPHKQAAAYYSEVANEKKGKFLVTMQEPSPQNPKPIVISIDSDGPCLEDKNIQVDGYTERKAPSIITGGQFA
jgi:hypothetical protein